MISNGGFQTLLQNDQGFFCFFLGCLVSTECAKEYMLYQIYCLIKSFKAVSHGAGVW